jgi:hypothetical protein
MLIATALLAALPLPQSDDPDVIVLTDGKEIECRVLYQDAEKVVYTKKRKEEEINQGRVKYVQTIETSLREFLDRYDQVGGEDVPGLLELANFCESRALFGEARHLRIRVVLLDPENETAWTKLGGTHTERKGWRLRVRGRFYTLDQLRERAADWKNAMEIPTAHFLVKTDVFPEVALDLAIDVERAYLTFYELLTVDWSRADAARLGDTLRLYPFDEVPELHIYASPDDYPEPPHPGEIAWFAQHANTLYVDATAGTETPHAAVGKLAELLLWNSFRRTVGKKGSIPPWTRDGFAQAFGAAYRSDPGHATWDLTQPIRGHFETHAGAEKPLSIEDVMRAGIRASESGTRAPLYTAQSYTLAHFLSHGDDRAYRAAFFTYLLAAFRGRSAAMHLEKALDMKVEDLEERWIAYVKTMAAGGG